jgi:predicted dinucleotide-binding enzyme
MKLPMKITIIGLGEQGISIGSALSSAKERFLRIAMMLILIANTQPNVLKQLINLYLISISSPDADIIALCESWDKLHPPFRRLPLV